MAAPKATNVPTLVKHYPWTKTPLIASAPMRLISTVELAMEVSRAGGLGFHAVGVDEAILSPALEAATNLFLNNPITRVPAGILPIGVGIICWGANITVVLKALAASRLKPAAVWLFASRDTTGMIAWTEGIRKATGGVTRIWVQLSTVNCAVQISHRCRPDVLVIQGSDAGGHGLKMSASIISLLPECADALKREHLSPLPLIAAGGIADGRGAAAALMLGASGVAMGTRFLTAPEANVAMGYRSDILRSSDGGISTGRTDVYDILRGTTGWPISYDGRGVLNESYYDSLRGVTEEMNKKLYDHAMARGDGGWGVNGRMTTYAGTAVGLIHELQPARDIVKEVLEGTKFALRTVPSNL